MLPARINRLGHHRYSINNIEVLKMASIYGANGAGKSNLLRSIFIFKKLVTTGTIPIELITEKFKLSKKLDDSVFLTIEFIKNKHSFLYEITLKDSHIAEENLYESGLGQKDDILLFSRKTINGNISVEFFKEFYGKAENVTLKNVIDGSLSKPNETTLHLLSTLSIDDLDRIKEASDWFNYNLIVITPYMRPMSLPHHIDVDAKFNEFAHQLICSFNTGVEGLYVEKKSIEDFLGNENKKEVERITAQLKADPKRIYDYDEDITITNEDDQIVAKQLLIGHKNEVGASIKFNLSEESNGTIRLLEYIPAIRDIIEEEITYIIDEIERSIHPLIIKEIITKFSLDDRTKGQLIFSTHESNILDQEILRQDEIWFVEKNNFGATELYPLSDFKERPHHTIDIRKGYLNGRYGAIPFLGNLHDLNWNKYATIE